MLYRQSIALVTLVSLCVLGSCSRSDPDRGPRQGGELGNASTGIKPAALVRPKDPKACRACESSSPCSYYIAVCDKLEGVANEGPRAGTPKKKLCQELMECVEHTGCAGLQGHHCYCGDAEGTDCLQGGAKGACKAQVEAAFESKDPGAVAVRFDQEGYAGTAAMRRYWCQHETCEKACF